MKAILEYILPEEKEDFDIVCKANELHSFVWDTSQLLRGYLKHGHQFKTADEVLEFFRNSIVEFSSEIGIQLP